MYQILLEGKQVKKNQVTGMHLMAGFLLLIMGLFTWLVPNAVKQAEFNFLNNIGLLYAAFGFALLIISVFFNKKIIQSPANFGLRIAEILLFISILAYSFIRKWYLPAAYSGAALLGIILAYYWERNGKKTRRAVFNDKGIFVTGLGRKSDMTWQDIKKVMLRHKVLTIDCKDNKLFQINVDHGQEAINQEDFEAYCHIQIEAKKHLYKEDW
ncbi:hypothetical protein [Taibaiella koreensis]|uniref:hypothetical protein n=1 Tax=Taibaiella koreensis TaxID=1268548 RepID=UPI000E59A169|nr:hypothetical protein [Taibaiella koreensis]